MADEDVFAIATLDVGEDEEGLWPCHVAVANAFIAVTTQWRMVGTMSGVLVTGLDYAGAKAGLEAAGITLTPRAWEDLRVMEIAACEEMNRSDG